MEPTVICPSCQTQIKLTESLAAPLIEATRRQFDEKLKTQTAEFAKREQSVKAREETLASEIDRAVAQKLKTQRAQIVAEESRKAHQALGTDLEQKAKELAELNAVLKQRDEKLAEAQNAQAELIRKQRELDDARREMELTIETRVQGSLSQVRDVARKDAEQELSLKVSEREQTIESMRTQIEQLKRKAEQGSQQTQGEALELQLESILSVKFPHDSIMPVPRGEQGGDILQGVNSAGSLHCGTILWESKRTRNWNDAWLTKLREDQRQAKAEIAVIVSATLPKTVETFDQVDGVWIVHPRCVLPVAMSLRHMLIEVTGARQVSEGQQTKMELIYHYLTGAKFRLRVQAIVEAFSTMNDDLLKEKKFILKQWSKREAQIHRVMEATVGMYGEMQGIAGQSLQEIDGLEMTEAPAALPDEAGSMFQN